MMKSSIYPNQEVSDYGDYGFDPQTDFLQFLEEAKRHKKDAEVRISDPSPRQDGDRSLGEKKSKKSWKSSLFSWWKADKKNKSFVESKKDCHISKARKGHVSGPIYDSGRVVEKRQRGPASGPLASLFRPSQIKTQKVESEIPYVPLEQLQNGPSVNSYGPVYLVT